MTDRPTPDPDAFPTDAPLAERARFVLEYAILAPSSHNSQPWAFAVDGGTIRIYADEARQLAVADPDGRELLVSVGCAVTNLVVAAERFGLGPTVDYVPERTGTVDADGTDDTGDTNRADDTDDGRCRHVATIRFDPAGDEPTYHPLFDAITTRRTNHQPFEDRPVPTAVRDRLAACTTGGVDLVFVDDEPTLRRIASLQAQADERLFDDPAYRRELGHSIGTGALGANWIAARVGEAAARRLNLGRREGEKNSALVESAPLLGVVVAESDDRAARLDAGRTFERVALTAECEGLAVHPMSQILEVPALAADLVDRLGRSASTPLHLFRVGHAEPDATVTPRRSVTEVVRSDADWSARRKAD